MPFLTSQFFQHPSYFSASPQVFFLSASENSVHLVKQRKCPIEESFTNGLCLSVGAINDFSSELARKLREPRAGESGGFDSGRNVGAKVKIKGG